MSLAEPVRLAEGQVAAAGAVLARAFANDPFFTCVLSDPDPPKTNNGSTTSKH